MGRRAGSRRRPPRHGAGAQGSPRLLPRDHPGTLQRRCPPLTVPVDSAFVQALRTRARGFFDTGEPIYLTRAPGRLDVMGGVADYSGSVVLEATLAEATHCAFQWRNDSRLRLWSDGLE